MKEFLKQFFYLLDPKAKKAMPFLVLMFIISSVLDVIGVGLIGLFLGLLTHPYTFLQKFPYFNFLVSNLQVEKLIIYSGLIIIFAFIIKAIIMIVIQNKIVYFCQSLSVRLKYRMMSAYQNAPYTYHLRKNSAILISTLQINLSNYINNVLLPSLSLISNVLIATFILSFLMVTHFISTALLIVMFTLVGLGYDLFAKRKLSSMGKVVVELGCEMIKKINHGIHGLTEIRVLGKEKYILKSLDKISSEYAYNTAILIALQQVPRYLIENTIAIFVIGLSLGGVIAGFDSGNVVAMVGMFAVAGARLLPTVNQIMSGVSQIRSASSNMRMVYEDLAELDMMKTELSKWSSSHDGDSKLDFKKMQLSNVSYQYPQTKQLALKNVDITIFKGQSIGLIGSSGAGKSTLINVILGLLDPDQGELRVDNHSVQKYRAWLNNFAYIPQTIYLLDDTVRRNIALGHEDEMINDERLWHAINMAQLAEVVNQLPQGIDTLIGENGVRLSGGQRQRIALARAFYYERDVIIMDEATSSLDNETEKEVIDTIKRLKGNKTLIIIAHRLSTVEHCDLLYRLDAGHIAAVGTFQEVVGALN